MKRILTYTIFCLLFVLTSCSEEQLDVYNGDNYVYFTYMSDKSPQKITFNFATDAPLLREGTVKVKMTLLGYLLEENATCDISAVGEKSTARSGIDYAPLTSAIADWRKTPTKSPSIAMKTCSTQTTPLPFHWMQWKTVWWVRQNTNTSRFK